jgi:hypothetical protein
MNAEQFLAYAETLRSYALHSGRDLNAANLFVHTMLMRALREQTVQVETHEKRQPPARAA